MKAYFKNLDLKTKILVAIAAIVFVAAITLAAMAGGGILTFRSSNTNAADLWTDYRTAFTGQYGASNAGSESNPYIIDTPQKLAQLAYNVNTGTNYANKYFKQTLDLDLSGYDWFPIGNVSHSFNGCYDGQNHKIFGMFINETNSDYIGLFGNASGNVSRVKNINIEDSIILGRSYVGSIVGYGSDGDKVQNCRSDATVISSQGGSNSTTGGIAGNGGTIENCTFTGHVVGNEMVGGIAGSSVYILNCENYGQVDGCISVGGITGRNWGYVKYCIQKGDLVVRNKNANAGLIAGRLNNSAGVPTIECCYAEGFIYAIYTSPQLGPIVGLCTDANGINITDCSAQCFTNRFSNQYYGIQDSGCGAVNVRGCFTQVNQIKRYSNGNFSNYSIVKNFNGGLPIQNGLYSIAVGEFYSSDITDCLVNNGYTYQSYNN